MTDPAAARSGAAPQLIEGKEEIHEDDPSRVDGLPSDRPLGSTASDIEAIRARLATRREPQIGTCGSCGHRQELPRIGMMTHARAESVWRCEQCHGPISVTVMCGSDEPSPDDDVAWLLQEVAALAAARLACQQEIEQLKDRLGAERALGHGIGQEHTIAAVNAGGVDDLIAPRLDAARAEAYPAYKREKALRCAAEAARTALRHDLQALITAWLADADALPGSELFDAAENRLRACARDLADRLAREEKK